jgi:hypothetical protein
VPVAADDVILAPHPDTGVSWSILYGLDQSTINLKKLVRPKAYKGTVGDSINNFYLFIDVANTGGSNTPRALIAGDGGDFWLQGTSTNVYLLGTNRSKDAVHIGGAVTNGYCVGSGVQGTVTFKAGMALTNLYMNNCPGAKVTVDTGVTGFTLIEATAGYLTNKSAVTTVNVGGSATVRHKIGAVTTWTCRGGYSYYDSSGTLTTEVVNDGVFDLRESEAAAVIISNCTVRGGHHTDEGGLVNVTYSNNLIKHGGSISTDHGRIVTAGA